MIGVKDFIKEFKEPVNWAEKAEKQAKKNVGKKATKEEVQEEIDKITAEYDKKRVKGETYQAKLCQKEVDSNPNAILGTYKAYDSSNVPETDSCKLDPNKVYLEKFLMSNKYEILGYADRIDTKGNIINITDNKVVEKIYRSSSFKTETGFKVESKKMLPPLQHLDDTNYNDFVLQLSLYMYLAWENNKNMKIGNLYIRHIVMNDLDKVTSDTTIPVPYLKDEVKLMLKYKLENK